MTAWVTDPVEALALRVLAETEVPFELPVPVERVAHALGVWEITPREMSQDGFIEARTNRIVIAVRAGVPDTRRRFTIAHEIGHLVLANPQFEAASLLRERHWGGEEQFCDAFAAALLLPASFLDGYSARPQTLFNLNDCAESAGVSARVAMIRLAQLAGWRKVLLRFSRHGGGWQFQSVDGLPSRHRAGLGMTKTTGELLDDVRRSRSGYRRAALTIKMAGRPALLDAEIQSKRWSAVALAAPLSQKAQPSRGGPRRVSSP
jgi:hypothetical protein